MHILQFENTKSIDILDPMSLVNMGISSRLGRSPYLKHSILASPRCPRSLGVIQGLSFLVQSWVDTD